MDKRELINYTDRIIEQADKIESIGDISMLLTEASTQLSADAFHVLISLIASALRSLTGQAASIWLDAHSIKTILVNEEANEKAMSPTEEEITKVREEVGDD